MTPKRYDHGNHNRNRNFVPNRQDFVTNQASDLSNQSMTFQLPVTVHYQLCCDIMSYVILFDSIQYTKSCPLICIFSYQAMQSSSSSPYSKAPALVNTATLYADKELNNSLVLSLDWLNKTSRQVVIFIYRQRTN